MARSYEFIFIFTHFLIGMVLGLLYKYPLVQISIILGLCIVLFIYTLAIRPFLFTIVLIFEIITQLLLIIALICLLISINYAKSGCFDCANREGFLCYFILGLLFAYLLLLALGLILFSLMAGCLGHKHFYKKKELPDHIHVSGGQNLSGMAQIDTIHQQNYQSNAMGMGAMGLGMGAMGAMGANAYNNHIHQSNQNYEDKTFVKNVMINEEKNESYEEVKIKEMSREDENMLSQGEEKMMIQHEDTFTEGTENEEIQFMQRNRDERTMHEFNKNIHSNVNQNYTASMMEGDEMYLNRNNNNNDNSILDRTMTMKVDTDDERIRQKKVLHALSVSDIGNQAMEDNLNQVNQAKRVVEMNKRSQMMSRNVLQDLDSDYDQMGRGGNYGRDNREFQLAHEYEETNHRNISGYDGGYQGNSTMGTNRNINVRGYDGGYDTGYDDGSDIGTEREYLGDTNVVKTRVNSQAVRDRFDTQDGDGSNYYKREEYQEKSYYKNN